MTEVVKLVTPWLLLLMSLCLVGVGVGRAIVLLRGALDARRNRGSGTDDGWSRLLRSDLVPAVAVIATPTDAGEASRRHVRRLLNLHAGNPEIVLVLDGPSDADLEAWKQEFHLQHTSRTPNPLLKTKPVRALYVSSEPIQLLVVDKERGGRADCLNAGINAGNAPMIAMVDDDAEFIEESLLGLLRPLLANPHTVAVCAVAPGVTAPGLLARFYRLEYLRTWLGRCAGMAASNAFLPAPGCFAMLSRRAVVQAGGFRAGLLEMAIRLHTLARPEQRPYRIVFIPAPISRPSAPRDYGTVRAAAARDQMEVGAALRFHWGSMLGFGAMPGLAAPGLMVSRFWLPLMETAALIGGTAATAAGWIELGNLALLVAAPLACGILVSMTAVLLEQLAAGPNAEPRDVAALFFSAIIENLGYRQWKNLWLVRDLWRGYYAAAAGAI